MKTEKYSTPKSLPMAPPIGPDPGMCPKDLVAAMEERGFKLTGTGRRFSGPITMVAQEWTSRGAGLAVDLNWVEKVDGTPDSGGTAMVRFVSGEPFCMPSKYLFSNPVALGGFIADANAYKMKLGV